MANPDDPRKSQDFFSIFTKAKEFTEELLKENERLRARIAQLESAGPPSVDAAGTLQQRV